MVFRKNASAGKAKAAEITDVMRHRGEIQKRAYEIYLGREAGRLPGDGLSDWLQAETEIKRKYKIA